MFDEDKTNGIEAVLGKVDILPHYAVLNHYYYTIYFKMDRIPTKDREASSRNKADALLLADTTFCCAAINVLIGCILFAIFKKKELCCILSTSCFCFILSLVFYKMIVSDYYRRQETAVRIKDLVRYLHINNNFTTGYLRYLKDSIPERGEKASEDNSKTFLDFIGNILSVGIPTVALFVGLNRFQAAEIQEGVLLIGLYFVLQAMFIFAIWIYGLPRIMSSVDGYDDVKQMFREDICYILNNADKFRPLWQDSQKNKGFESKIS